MKKILTLSLMLALLAAAASAQRGSGDRTRDYRLASNDGIGQTARQEKNDLRKDGFRYKVAKRNARRDGRISPSERRRLRRMKRDIHRDAYRFKHRHHRRFI